MPHSMLLPHLHSTCKDTSIVIWPAVHTITVIIASVDATELMKCLPSELGIIGGAGMGTAAVGAHHDWLCHRNLLLIARSLERLRCGVFLTPPHLRTKHSKLLLHPCLQGAEGPHQQGELVLGDRSSFVRLIVRHCGLTDNFELEVVRSLHILGVSTKQMRRT